MTVDSILAQIFLNLKCLLENATQDKAILN